MLLTQVPSAFPASTFAPVVLGFFGLGTGYLIVGPQELIGWPERDSSIDRANGFWGIWMPGFCQLLTGTYLFIGLTWFPVFVTQKALYMAALAFTAYGVHWFAIGWNRYRQSDIRPNGFMCVPFMIISALGALVFFLDGSWPVGVLFIGLFAVYVTEFFASFAIGARQRTTAAGEVVTVNPGERALGAAHTLTGMWLMYLTFATTLNIASGFKLPGG